MTGTDQHIVERYAAYLDRRAESLVTRLVAAFGLVGGALGAFPLFLGGRSLVPHHLGYAMLLVGTAAGGYLGYAVGDRRAQGLRLQAQLARHQLQLESLLQRQVAPPAPVETAAPAPPPAPPAPPVLAPLREPPVTSQAL